MDRIQANKHNPKRPCQKCNGNIVNSDDGVILTSTPPQVNVHCDKCNYKGYRLA